MINAEKSASTADSHTTLVFKACGLFDSAELAGALRLLGVPVAKPASASTGAGAMEPGCPEKDQGPWLACSLDSDGTFRLWPAVQRP